CVVTLTPVDEDVQGTFETFFTMEHRAGREIELLPEDAAEDAEIIENGQVDLGEVVTQYLSLELNPYPRAPGVAYAVGARQPEGGGDARKNPFAVLQGMREILSDKDA